MAWHRYTLVVLGLTASLCVQKGNSDDTSTATEMINKMNLSADPCEDFHEFACGGFIENSEITNGRFEVSTVSSLHDDVYDTIHDIIQEEYKPTDPQYLSNIKRFYNSCMDEDTIEAVGLTPYLNEREFVDDWPTLNPRWSGANFDLNEVIVRYSKVFIDPIFTLTALNDVDDNSKIIIYLLRGFFPLDEESYRLPRNSTVLQAYENYLVEFAVALNASREVAEQDAKDVVDLEIELVKLMDQGDANTTTTINNTVQLHQLSTMYPELDIAGSARAVYGLINITLTGDEKVINFNPNYFGNISLIVQKFSNRTLQSIFGFYYAMSRVGMLTHQMRQIVHDFFEVSYGYDVETPRRQFCAGRTIDFFRNGISKQFVNRTFSEAAKHDVYGMIGNFKKELMHMIKKTGWMSNDTKAKAHTKLRTMKWKVGYPDDDFEEPDIEKLYEKHIMKEDDYYSNALLANKLNILETLAADIRPVDKNKWNINPHEIKVNFDNLHNEIVVPAGILQRPFYDERFKDYINYAAIGSAIGHAIIRGFYDKGEENNSNWWAHEDSSNYSIETECIREEYSRSLVGEIGSYLNESGAQEQSIADIGGLKIAYRGYKRHVRHSSEQPRLPGLNLTHDQVFFVSFAQQHCAKYDPEILTTNVETAKRTPGKYRILIALQNSYKFADAYNCSAGSFMNPHPHHKCNFWSATHVTDYLLTPSG